MADAQIGPVDTPVPGIQHGKGTLIDSTTLIHAGPGAPNAAAGSSAVDTARIRAAVLELLSAIGEDPLRLGLVDTPSRVAESFTEYFSGIAVDPLSHLQDAVAVGAASGRLGEMVLLRDVEFRSMCEHHLLPFVGVAHLAYLPGERVVGLGRLAKVVDTLAARPQLQERLTEQIADALEAGLAPLGVFVMLDATHLCLSSRGTRQARSSTVTTAVRGGLREPAARTEIIAMIGAHRG